MNAALAALSALTLLLMAQAQTSVPEPATLVKEIEAHQRRMDELREDYTFREFTLTDELNANGSVSKTDSEEREVFFVHGYRIARLVEKRQGIERGGSRERTRPCPTFD